MFYRFVRAVVAFALKLFYRLEVTRRVEDLSGPVMFVGNHPNSIVDPAMVFVITNRPVTFLAKEPLFRVPLFGWLLKGLGALPVYRKQDHPGDMQKNEGTLSAAQGALTQGKAITIFPEGKSHSQPQLAEIKTGCARIALKVAKSGVALRIIPVGFTYTAKHRFKSRVHVEVGEPILVQKVDVLEGEAEQAWVRELTDKVDQAMHAVTLNLEEWDDLELVETADRLFALRNGFREKDPDRLRKMAAGAAMLRREQSERFDELKEDIMTFRARLDMVNAKPEDLSVRFEARAVTFFVLRNLVALLFGFPLAVLGFILFSPPFMLLRLVASVAPLARDRVATLKLIGALVLAPAWWTALSVAGWALWGLPGLLTALIGALPLAIYTRYFVERRRAAVGDAITFFRLGNRNRLRQHLLFEGERLQEEIARLAAEYAPRVESRPSAPAA